MNPQLNKLKKTFDKLGAIAQNHSILASEFNRLEYEFFGFGMCDDIETHSDDIISGHMLGENPCDFLYYLEKMTESQKRKER
jgi:hypothetical protein